MKAAGERTVVLGGTVRLEDLVAVARHHARVKFSEEYRERVKRCRPMWTGSARRERPSTA